jgi:glycosyltransferase involved in cell wall biosynthesis
VLSIIFPTRNRPANVTRFVDSIFDTASNVSDIELCIYLDDDDVVSIPVIEETAKRINTQALQGNIKIGSHMYNELYRIATGDLFMFAADDIVFRTKGWDDIVKQKFNEVADKILFVYGEDGFQRGRIGTHGFIHANWIDAVGYVLPPKLASSYTDEWITELSERVGRKCYLPDLLIEHLHPAVGKAPVDNTYSGRTEIQGNLAAVYKSLESDRVKDAALLQEFINNFKS